MNQRLEQGVSRIALGVAVVASLAAAFKAFVPRRTALSAETAAVVALGDSAMLIGSPRAKQTVLLATDHVCPYCRQMRESLSIAMAVDSLRFNVRIIPFPLTEIHPTAELSARILVCAARRAKQQVADSILFDLGSAVVEIPLGELAVRLELREDSSSFVSCVESDDVEAYVRHTISTIRSAGANSTPTMWVNGKRTSGLVPVDSILGGK